MFIGLKQWIWKGSAGTMVSVESKILVITVVLLYKMRTLW